MFLRKDHNNIALPVYSSIQSVRIVYPDGMYCSMCHLNTVAFNGLRLEDKGTPRYFTMNDEGFMIVKPVADRDYTIKVLYTPPVLEI